MIFYFRSQYPHHLASMKAIQSVHTARTNHVNVNKDISHCNELIRNTVKSKSAQNSQHKTSSSFLAIDEQIK